MLFLSHSSSEFVQKGYLTEYYIKIETVHIWFTTPNCMIGRTPSRLVCIALACNFLSNTGTPKGNKSCILERLFWKIRLKNCRAKGTFKINRPWQFGEFSFVPKDVANVHNFDLILSSEVRHYCGLSGLALMLVVTSPPERSAIMKVVSYVVPKKVFPMSLIFANV